MNYGRLLWHRQGIGGRLRISERLYLKTWCWLTSIPYPQPQGETRPVTMEYWQLWAAALMGVGLLDLGLFAITLDTGWLAAAINAVVGAVIARLVSR